MEAIGTGEGEDRVVVVECQCRDCLGWRVKFADDFEAVSGQHVDVLVSGGDQVVASRGKLEFLGLLDVVGVEQPQVVVHQVVNLDLIVEPNGQVVATRVEGRASEGLLGDFAGGGVCDDEGLAEHAPVRHVVPHPHCLVLDTARQKYRSLQRCVHRCDLATMASISNQRVLNLDITERLSFFALPGSKQLVQLLASLRRQNIIPKIDRQSTLVLESSYHSDLLLIAIQNLHLIQKTVHALM